ncbi:hypothetical protein pb186bvf_012266 [Paramecium bursaria]
MNQNTELMIISQIDRTADDLMKPIIVSLNSKKKYTRLGEFLKDYLQYIIKQNPKFTNAGIELLNHTITYFDKDRPKVKDFDQAQVKLDKQIIEQKLDLLGNHLSQIKGLYFEKALIFGAFEGFQHLQYNNYRFYAEKYAENPQNADKDHVPGILKKMEESFQERQQGQDFEVLLFEKLIEEEADCIDKIITLSSKMPQVVPNKAESRLDKWYKDLPTDKKQIIQEKGQGNPIKCRQVIIKDYVTSSKIDQKSRDLIQEIRYINTLDKLQQIIIQYEKLEVLKKKNKRQGLNDIKKALDSEEQLLQQYQQSQQQFPPQQLQRIRQFQEMNLERFKYFYKYYKVKNVNGEQRKMADYVSLRKQYYEFFLQIIQKFDLPKKNKGQIQWSRNFITNYQQIYISLIDDYKKWYEFLVQVQEFMIKYFKFRFIYLVLVYQMVVELDLTEQELQKSLNIVLNDMIKKTTKEEICSKDYSFAYIVSKFKQLSGHEITPINTQLGENYQNLATLEITLKHLTNKLLGIIISSQQGQQDKLKQQSINDICCFEVFLLNECNSNSRQTTSKFAEQLQTDSEDKENKIKFFQAINKYHQRVSQIMNINFPQSDEREKNTRQQKSNNYKKSIDLLRQDYFSSEPPIINKQIFDKDMQMNDWVRRIIEHEAQNYSNNNIVADQYLADILLKIRDAFFRKETNQIIYNSYLLKALSFFFTKARSQQVYESIEKKRYLFIIGGEKYGPQMMEQLNKGGEELIIRQLSLAEQYKLAVQTYNTALETFKFIRQDAINYERLSDQFPKTSSDLKSYNTSEYNFCCYIILKITGNMSSQSNPKYRSIQNEDELYAEITKIQDLKRATEKENEDLIIKDLQSYKQELIKEANEYQQKNAGSNKFTEGLLQIFQKQYYHGKIMESVIKLKDTIQIELNKKEKYQKANLFWSEKSKLDTQFLEDKEKLKIRNHINEIFRNSGDISDLISKFNEKLKMPPLEQPRNFVEKYIDDFNKLFVVEPENRPPIPLDNIKNRLKQLRNEKYKDISEVFDQSVLTEIGFQFDFFIKNIIGQVLQVSLTQKKGDEIKVFQNKQDNQTQQNTKYKQLKDMYTKYGHQKDSTINIVLQTSQETKPLLSYSLCDMTPFNRYQEFMKLKYDLEPIQDDIIKNKIRRNKWKDEHPQLEDVLQKKIKRGTELWSQVQEFLLKRDRPALPAESSDEDDKPVRQESENDTVDPQDELHRKVNEAQIQQKQSNERNVPTQLKNVEKDIPYLVQKDITTRMVQHVLENMPYYKKSKILLRSYLFS